jgi:hypothetical protein
MTYKVYLCGGDDRLALDPGECLTHTPHPLGYTDWHIWAAKMAKTHRQERCTDCGKFGIWRQK